MNLSGNNMKNLPKRNEIKKKYGSRIESPIEQALWRELKDYGLYLIPQYQIGKYRVDFALPEYRLIIECDGKEWHRDKEKDKIRDNELGEKGWTVMRIEGYRIKYYINQVIKEILASIGSNKLHFDNRKDVKIDDDMSLDVQEELEQRRKWQQEEFEDDIEEELKTEKWASIGSSMMKRYLKKED